MTTHGKAWSDGYLVGQEEMKRENARLREIVRKQTEALKAVEKWNAPMSLEIYPAIKISNAIKLGEGI